MAGTTVEVALWGLTRSLFNPIPPRVIDLERNAGGLRFLLSGDRGTSAGDLTWGAGFEVELQSDDRKNFENDSGEPGDLTLDQQEKVRSTGLFARLGVPLGQRVSAMASLRYDRARFEAEDRFTVDDPDDSGMRTMDALSPSIGINIEATPSLSFWGNVSTSLETPTTTELVNRPEGTGGFNPDLDPQRAVGFEAGLKGSSGRASYEFVGFLTDITDALVPFESELQEGRTFFRNAGSVTHKGVEAQLQVDLGNGALARIGYTRVDARFDEFEVDGDVFDGNRIPGQAPNRVDALLTQERDQWFWAVVAEWVDEVPVNDANTPFEPVPDLENDPTGYTVIDLRAGLRNLDVGDFRWSPFAGISNIFDQRYSAAVTINAFGSRYYEPGPGRTFYVGASIRGRQRAPNDLSRGSAERCLPGDTTRRRPAPHGPRDRAST